MTSPRKENEDLRGLKIPNQISIIESADQKSRTSFDHDHMIQTYTNFLNETVLSLNPL